MADSLSASREIRGWIKLFQSGENVKKLEALTFTLNGLRAGFSGVNNEMQQFNQNISKSNEFLGRIAKLQESMEAQTKATSEFLGKIARLQESIDAQNRVSGRLTWVVVGLAVLQVILTAVQIWLK